MRGWWLAAVLLWGGCLAEYTVGGAGVPTTCPEGQECEACADGQVRCDGVCVVAEACDEGCPEGQVMCDGACAAAGACDGGCPEGQVMCGSECVAAASCGCDRGCDEELEVCADDVCVCRDGLRRCGGVCVDTRADAGHCGGCGDACEAAEVCAAGECAGACAGPLQACGGGCVDLGSDALHCGECGDACDADEVCVVGECRDFTAYADCDACPCAGACALSDGECCDSPFLGAPVCVEDGCGED